MHKRILLITTVILSLSAFSLFSQNAFELAVYGNGGVNFSFPNEYNAEFLRNNTLTNYPLKGVTAFPDTGVGIGFSGSLQLGYYIDLYKEISGVSILFDGTIAYTRSSFLVTFQGANILGGKTNNYNEILTYQSDSFSINAGFIVKMHVLKNFAFGLGGGVKLYFFNDNINLNIEQSSTNQILKKSYTSKPVSIISPYAKVTVEYSLFLTGNFSIRLGLYGDLDIGQLLLGEKAGGKTMLVSVGGSLGFGYLFRID